jgi:hypothetical protein
MPAVEEMPSGQPTGNGRGPQPYRRPARRPGIARDRGMDFTDYLIQQQQAWQQSRIDKLFRSDEDRDAQIARRIRDQAQDSAEGAAAAASEAEEALVEVITEARDLRKKTTSGVVSPEDTRHALAKLRQRHKKIAAHSSPSRSPTTGL